MGYFVNFENELLNKYFFLKKNYKYVLSLHIKFHKFLLLFDNSTKNFKILYNL
jgi:hypothetical protein